MEWCLLRSCCWDLNMLMVSLWVFGEWCYLVCWSLSLVLLRNVDFLVFLGCLFVGCCCLDLVFVGCLSCWGCWWCGCWDGCGWDLGMLNWGFL